ncbi:MAG: LuxR C-terminal-related transcriptional regulator [Treponema sp.]
MKKLILIDDHKMLRKGIASFITEKTDWQIAFEAESLDEVPAILEKIQCRDEDIFVAVVDIQLKSESEYSFSNGFSAVKMLAEKNIPSVIFSSHDTGSCIEKAMSAEVGAKGFVSKCSSEQILIDALDAVSQGYTYIQTNLITNFLARQNLFSMLSKREQQIIKFIEQNLSNKEIAQNMNIKITTLDNYISIIYDKLGCQNRRELLEKLK